MWKAILRLIRPAKYARTPVRVAVPARRPLASRLIRRATRWRLCRSVVEEQIPRARGQGGSARTASG